VAGTSQFGFRMSPQDNPSIIIFIISNMSNWSCVAKRLSVILLSTANPSLLAPERLVTKGQTYGFLFTVVLWAALFGCGRRSRFPCLTPVKWWQLEWKELPLSRINMKVRSKPPEVTAWVLARHCRTYDSLFRTGFDISIGQEYGREKAPTATTLRFNPLTPNDL
jgi:hypothetical protein